MHEVGYITAWPLDFVTFMYQLEIVVGLLVISVDKEEVMRSFCLLLSQVAQ